MILFNPKLAIIKEKIVNIIAYFLYETDFGNILLNISEQEVIKPIAVFTHAISTIIVYLYKLVKLIKNFQI